MSAEQVATATCPHSFAVGICKNGFSDPILQNISVLAIKEQIRTVTMNKGLILPVPYKSTFSARHRPGSSPYKTGMGSQPYGVPYDT